MHVSFQTFYIIHLVNSDLVKKASRQRMGGDDDVKDISDLVPCGLNIDIT